MSDDRLFDYCRTDWQREVLQAVIDEGSNKKAADKLGRGKSAIGEIMASLRERAAQKGYAPEAGLDHPIAEGFGLQGYSKLTKTIDGEPIWLKANRAQIAYMEGIIEAVGNVKPIDYKIAPAPPEPQSDIIPWLQIGDAHIGMLASEFETGKNFDTKIAEQEICAAALALLERAPPSERIVINDLGDGTHYETFKAETEASGNRQDYDTRYWKMIQAYIRITRFIIEAALSKAEQVDYIANQGNHSRSNDIWIAALVSNLYPERVNVIRNESPFIAYRMGKTLVMVHHGDKVKPEKCRNIMAHDWARDWGETEFRYIDGGHVHTSRRLEMEGVTFESWNNLAPNDKWAHDSGYRSKQSMALCLRSRNYGQTHVITEPIERVRDRILAKQPHYVPPERRAFTA